MHKIFYPTSQVKTMPIGLFSGKMGVAVYWFHCARVFIAKDYEEQALALLEEIQEEICHATTFGYANGLAGIGSAICYLFRENFIEPPYEDFFSDFDTYFFNKVCFEQHTDLSRDTGLIGMGFYLLNRIKDMPAFDNMVSAKLRHLLLLIQDVLFARLGMNGYTCPFLKMDTLTESVIFDIKRFLKHMLNTELCPELTRKAMAITDVINYSSQTIFTALEDAYNQHNCEMFRSLMKTIAEAPEDSPAKQLAMLQIQDMSLPPWWELF